MKCFLVLTFAIASLAQAAFVPPNDGPVPFRRDKLPVDADTMTSLSKQLVLLTGTMDTSKAEETRRAAQILGLALALDPDNRQGLPLLRQLE
ncbi:hypothetical protein, partial [Haloferula sp.]|uniref:hypothetical protein n=1 Tax=Haloferula sp. TaxID=2497595 RepID=UPI003C7428FD